jgi:hypothetical protein
VTIFFCLKLKAEKTRVFFFILESKKSLNAGRLSKLDVKFYLDTFLYKKHFHRRSYATRKDVLPIHGAILQKRVKFDFC